MWISILSTTFVWNMFHSKNLVRYDQKCVLVLVKYYLFLSDF